jgi:threonine dehydratase
MNFDRLRFVAERAEVGEAREAVFAVTMPEQRGSFKRFCALVGPRNVTEFNYRISDAREAHVFVGVQIARPQRIGMARAFEEHGFKHARPDPRRTGQAHIRHLVGGKSALAKDELLYRFEFPERPGALMRFLDSMAPNWNISLFHYRNQGGDVGRILVGLQVPAGEMDEFRAVPGDAGLPLLGRERQSGLQAVPWAARAGPGHGLRYHRRPYHAEPGVRYAALKWTLEPSGP